MSKHHIVIALIVLLWLCVPLLSAGTYYQAESPQYTAYWNHLAEQLRAEIGNNDAGSGQGIGLALAPSWEFAAMTYSGLAALLSIAVLVVTYSRRHNRIVTILMACAAGILCVLSAFNGAREAILCFEWQFTLLAVAQSLWASTSVLALVYTVYMTCASYRRRTPS